MTELPIVAVPAALISAGSFGLSGALQHHAARSTELTGTVRFRFLTDLVRHPMWLFSLVTAGLGVAFQWVALSTGPLILVQPLLVTGLLFAVLISAALRRERPDRVVVLGTLLCGAGLAAFLLLAAPSPGTDDLDIDEVLPLACVLAVILAVCLTAAVRHPGMPRVLGLATATGVLYGVTAGLTKLAVEDLREGVGVMVTDWPIYLVMICGPLGFLLNQNAFRVGVAIAPALAMIVVLDPLVSIGVGVLWLGEHVNPAPGALVALAVLAAAVVVLSKRAPQAAAASVGGAGHAVRMSDGDEVEVRDNPDEHRYEAWLDGKRAGFAEYRAREGLVIVMHTEVPEEFGGRGVGSALVRGTLDDLRARGLRVRPVCPFFKSWIEKHPEYEDLVK